jgi:hypothetical protein
MPWYGRLCGSCGKPAAAAVDDPHARVLCAACLPGDLPPGPADTSECMSIGSLREALVSFAELGGAWGSNVHESKRVLLDVHGEVWESARVRVSFRYGRIVLLIEAGQREHIL